MKAKDIMSSPVLAVKPIDTVAHAKNLMMRHKITRLVVMDKGKPAGIITMHDLATRIRSGSSAWKMRTIDNIPVTRLMTKKVLTVSLGTDVTKAATIMLDKGISSLVVVDGGEVAGILTKTDLVRYFYESLADRYKVKDLMSKDVVTANRMHSIARIVELMEEYGVRRIIITAGDKPIGLITESDIAFARLDFSNSSKGREIKYTRKLERGGRPMARYVKYVALLTAEDIMRKELVTIDSESDAAQAALLMMRKGISGLPVVERDRLVGILTKTDITRGVRKAGD